MANLVLQPDDRAGRRVRQTELRLATISTVDSSAGSTLIFDGETTATQKRYKRLDGGDLYAGDRVLVAAVSGSYIIIGKIT